jgi:hypothetical protein
VQDAVDLTDVSRRALKRRQQNARSALPSVRPKPRSSGSATMVAWRGGRGLGCTSSFVGLIRSCQFLLITGRPLFRIAGTSMVMMAVAAAETLPNLVHGSSAKYCPASRATLVERLNGGELQTRRRLRGRQPLCGIGVTSRIEVT